MAARILALAVVLGISACDNRDEDFEREIRGICDSLELGTTTLQQGAVAFSEGPVLVQCGRTGTGPGDLLPLDGQTCEEGTSVCAWRYQFLTNDCGPGGCTFACDVRVPDAATGLDTPICARRFLKQQPFVIN